MNCRATRVSVCRRARASRGTVSTTMPPLKIGNPFPIFKKALPPTETAETAAWRTSLPQRVAAFSPRWALRACLGFGSRSPSDEPLGYFRSSLRDSPDAAMKRLND